MTHTWEQLEGVSLAGEYGLEQWLGNDSTGAFFLTSFGPERRRTVLKLTAEDPSTGGVQLGSWQKTARLTHPSLLALLDCGRTDYQGDGFLYAVFEAPDDSLTAAVQNGPLSEQEARDVLVAALGALRYLHTWGWAHTSIDAEHVVAVGDRIKLASDTLRSVNGSQAAQSDDVWALGALIYELLTARRIGRGETADVAGISEPLRTIIQRSVEPDTRYRWTVAQMEEALNHGQGVAIEPVETEPAEGPSRAKEPWAPAEEPLLARSVAATEHGPADQSFAAPGPVAPPSASIKVAEQDSELRENGPRPRAILVHEPFTSFDRDKATHEPSLISEPLPSEPQGFSRYVPLLAVATVALVAIIFVIVHHATPTPPAVAIVPPPVAEPAARVIPASAPSAAGAPQAPSVTSKPSPTSKPSVTSKPSATSKPRVASAPGQPLQSWRVIAYTYFHYKDAEKKARSINGRFADLHAEVFTPKSSPSSYLISLGANLTREEAAALQKKAIDKGLPRDTYIQNF